MRENRAFHEKQIDVDKEREMKRRELIRKYDQKPKIFRELELEKQERLRREQERQRMLTQRRNDHTRTEQKLD